VGANRSAEVAACYLRTGECLEASGNLDAAYVMLRGAHEIWKVTGHSDRVMTARCLRCLERVERGRKHSEQAEMFRIAAEIVEKELSNSVKSENN
jgi:hypothetical protein